MTHLFMEIAMLRVTVTYAIDPQDLESVKAGASKYLGAIQPALRLEVLARSLGFNSWAAMKSSNFHRAEILISPALEFSSERGIEFDPLQLHHAMAQATLLRVAKHTPLLHKQGMGDHHFWSDPEVLAELGISRGQPRSYSIEQSRRRRELVEEKMAASRQQLMSYDSGSGVLRAMALFAALQKTKKVSPKASSSYGLKHVAERIGFDLGGGLSLNPSYVANSEVIIAALDLGFAGNYRYDELNPKIGITAASLNSAISFANQRQYATAF